MDLLLKKMRKWGKGNWFEKRAAAAALAEPRLLKQPHNAKQVLQILNQITTSMEQAENTGDDSFKVLRQGMAYCWSGAVAVLPEVDKPMMESWLTSTDKNILWIMKEILKKQRMVKMDARWVEAGIVKLREAAAVRMEGEKLAHQK